jgi:hypothetical protein
MQFLPFLLFLLLAPHRFSLWPCLFVNLDIPGPLPSQGRPSGPQDCLDSPGEVFPPTVLAHFGEISPHLSPPPPNDAPTPIPRRNYLKPGLTCPSPSPLLGPGVKGLCPTVYYSPALATRLGYPCSHTILVAS